jgi:hypothetical protein
VVRCNGLEREDYACELAVAHLLDCCPHFRASHVLCETDRGCGGIDALPSLLDSESRCILARDHARHLRAGDDRRALRHPHLARRARDARAGKRLRDPLLAGLRIALSGSRLVMEVAPTGVADLVLVDVPGGRRRPITT